MKILIASDHAGFQLKTQLVEKLRLTDELTDLGPIDPESVDYPDYADKVCLQLKTKNEDLVLKEFGILICGTGQGMVIRANKYPQIRAALVYNTEIAILSREHNHANIICLGARFCSLEQALEWVSIFKKTAFAGGRHQSRVAKTGYPIS